MRCARKLRSARAPRGPAAARGVPPPRARSIRASRRGAAPAGASRRARNDKAPAPVRRSRRNSGVDLDRVERARRRRGAKMIVLAADAGAPREPVGAEQDSRQRLEGKLAAVLRHVAGRDRFERRDVAQDSSRAAARAPRPPDRVCTASAGCPSPDDARPSAHWCTNVWWSRDKSAPLRYRDCPIYLKLPRVHGLRPLTHQRA